MSSQLTEYRILWLSLDASGRTTGLYQMKLGELVTTIPTIGFNAETIEHLGASVTVWDGTARCPPRACGDGRV